MHMTIEAVIDPTGAAQGCPISSILTPASPLNIALADIALTMQNQTLLLQLQPRGGYPTKDDSPPPADPPCPVVFCGADRIMAWGTNRKDEAGEFLRDAQGRIQWVRWGGRVRVKVE